MTDQSPSGPVPIAPCDHCELIFRADQSYPVIITGGQTYAGHVFRQHGEPRHVWLCRACYAVLQEATIDWLRVEDDPEPRLTVQAEG